MHRYIFLFHVFLVCFLFNLNIFAQEVQYDSVIYEYQYDTIYEYDTLFLAQEKPVKNITENFNIEQNTNIDFGISLGSFFPINHSESDSIDFSKLSKVVTNALSYQFNFFARYNYKNWFLKIGLGVTCLREKITASPTNLVISKSPYQKTDTISSYYTQNGEEITWHYITRNNTYYNYDSTFENTPYINKIWVTEIPLIVGYSIIYKNLSYNFETGLIPGLILETNSKNIGISSDGSLHYIDKSYMRNFQLAFIYTSSLNIRLNHKLVLQPGVTYRYQIISIYSNDYIYHYKPISLGINCNLIYKF